MYFKLSLLLVICTTASLYAGKYPSADEAVRQLFPDATYTRESMLLTKEEQKSGAEFANQEKIGALVTRYVVRKEDGIVGYAYLDKHLVRTHPEILLVALDAHGAMLGIKVLAFQEPTDYLAQDGWLDQFKGKTVANEIRMRKNIDGITGATLTARAVTESARRILAVHQVVSQRGK